MARAALTVTAVSRAGVALPAETDGNATDNHTVANDERTIVLARNSNGAATARTVTVHIDQEVDGVGGLTKTYSIAAGATKAIGPFPTKIYGNPVLLDVDNAELKLRALRY